MTICNTDRLSEYLDDELTPAGRREVDLHLAGCAECRLVLEELALVKQTAAELTELDRVPDADLWPHVAWRMKQRKGISLSWVQALAAALVLITLSGGAVWMALDGGRSPAPGVAATDAADRGPEIDAPPAPVAVANFADEAYESAVRDLRRALESDRNRLDPQTIQVIERNLTAIDRAIGQARQALEADPANVSLNTYLAGVRRRKLDLLRTASELAQPAS
ncbi:MAG: zf-HC2 domain-containing protein [Vicinamibacterales bacterium]